jgi:hypothetical protein
METKKMEKSQIIIEISKKKLEKIIEIVKKKSLSPRGGNIKVGAQLQGQKISL